MQIWLNLTITATRTTSKKIECVTPAHKVGTVEMGVGFHGGTYEAIRLITNM